jgi:bifunctional non-homologous end joining protein LigD
MATLDDQDQDLLAEYRSRRDFAKTPEPAPKRNKKAGNSFVIQKHAATRTHFDFRLELDGVLKSWAVTKGPSFDTAQKRLAVRTEDHPLEYGGFEGVIPKGEYGGGPVMLWDRGTWEPVGDPHKGLAKGHLDLVLHGERLKGEWHLVRMKKDKRGGKRENWLLIKASDDYAKEGSEPTQDYDTSVESGRSMEQILNGESAVWTSNRSKTPGAKKGASKTSSGKRWHGKPPPPSRKATAPEFISPQLASLDDEVPEGDDWIHEVKFDGYRIQARKDGDRVTLYSRSGLDWTARFPAIAEALNKLPAKKALIDGEAAFVLESGLTDFKSLQEHIDTDHPAIRYYAFDLLELDGKSLMKEPLLERKEALQKLFSKKNLPDRLVYSDHIEGQGEAFFGQACRTELEGIISKRANAPYKSGRSKTWLKVKCGRRAEFVIGGYSKSSAQGRPFASLLLGTFQDGDFVFAGKVGTGFNTADMKRLADKFAPLKRKTSPFVEVPSADQRDAVWLTPKLVCEIAFTEWTKDGRLRHPSFQGLREDKPAEDVTRDPPDKEIGEMAEKTVDAPAKAIQEKGGKPQDEFDGVTLTNPDRVLFPQQDLTKRDIAEYYQSVAEAMLPYVVNRPISLVRCPEGRTKECFFQRHAMRGMSKAIKEVFIPGGETKKKYLYIDDAAGLFSLVQIGVLEIHDWGVSLKNIDKPDRVVFDLDPDEGFDFESLKDAAVETRDFLADLGLKSFLKSTGGKGLHVVAPITARAGWDEVKEFCKAVADALVTARGDRYTANMSKRARKGKIFVDYLRNQRGGSAIVNFSTRAREGAPVACPLRWDELSGLKSPSPYTVKTLPQRLASLKDDPWEGFFKTRQSITKKAKKDLGLE